MNLRTLFIALALALLGAFAVLNWSTFTTPTALWLGFVEVQAPLGLVMLVVTVAISALFLMYIVVQQAGVIMETRRFAKELKAQRELADTAEASRFTELRAYLTTELGRLEARSSSETNSSNPRIDKLEAHLRDKLDEVARSLSAHLGEIEDKLDRALHPTPPG